MYVNDCMVATLYVMVDNCMPTLIIISKTIKLLSMIKRSLFSQPFTNCCETHCFQVYYCDIYIFKKNQLFYYCSKFHLHYCLKCYHFSHICTILFFLYLKRQKSRSDCVGFQGLFWIVIWYKSQGSRWYSPAFLCQDHAPELNVLRTLKITLDAIIRHH